MYNEVIVDAVDEQDEKFPNSDSSNLTKEKHMESNNELQGKDRRIVNTEGGLIELKKSPSEAREFNDKLLYTASGRAFILWMVIVLGVPSQYRHPIVDFLGGIYGSFDFARLWAHIESIRQLYEFLTYGNIARTILEFLIDVFFLALALLELAMRVAICVLATTASALLIHLWNMTNLVVRVCIAAFTLFMVYSCLSYCFEEPLAALLEFVLTGYLD